METSGRDAWRRTSSRVLGAAVTIQGNSVMPEALKAYESE